MGYRDDFFENNKSKNGKYKCAYCGEKLRKKDVDVDHIVPKSRGGSNQVNNLTASCSHCNRQKGAMDDVEYGIYRDEWENEIEETFERNEKKYGYQEAVRREAKSKMPFIK